MINKGRKKTPKRDQPPWTSQRAVPKQPLHDEELYWACSVAHSLSRQDNCDISELAGLALVRIFAAQKLLGMYDHPEEALDEIEHELRVLLRELGIDERNPKPHDPNSPLWRSSIGRAAATALVALRRFRDPKRPDPLEAFVLADCIRSMHYRSQLLSKVTRQKERLRLHEAWSRGGKARAVSLAKKTPNYQQEIDKLVLERGLSYSNACERVAGSEGVAKRTIERHTSNPSKTHDT